MCRDDRAQRCRSLAAPPVGTPERFRLRRQEPGARPALLLPIPPGPIRRVPFPTLHSVVLVESIGYLGRANCFLGEAYSSPRLGPEEVFRRAPERGVRLGLRGRCLGPRWSPLGQAGERLGVPCGCSRAGGGRPRRRSSVPRGGRSRLGGSVRLRGRWTVPGGALARRLPLKGSTGLPRPSCARPGALRLQGGALGSMLASSLATSRAC